MSGLTVETLFAPFPGPDATLDFEVISGESMPEPYRSLLVHEYHMTVTVESHHGSLVNVVVLQRHLEGASYARKILLSTQSTGKVVMFGIVHIDLDMTGAEVRAAIVEGKTPLGRILIDHDVLRRIEPLEFLKIRPNAAQLAWFGIDHAEALYGRLAIIHCNEMPAVELLEIVAP